MIDAISVLRWLWRFILLVILSRILFVMLFFSSSSLVSAQRSSDRADILDRNGMVLATNRMSLSLYIHPKEISNTEKTADTVSKILNMDKKVLLAKIKSKSSFVWIAHNLSSEQVDEIKALKDKNLHLRSVKRRYYPSGAISSHVVGIVNDDFSGVSGIERHKDEYLSADTEPVYSSVDLRAQSIMHKHLSDLREKYSAKAVNGIFVDMKFGEVVAMVSLPDFDPNNRKNMASNSMFDRNMQGSYEIGSVVKVYTIATALYYGIKKLSDTYPASMAFRLGGFRISDYHRSRGMMTLEEGFTRSSNIVFSHLGADIGGDRHRDFRSLICMDRPIYVDGLGTTSNPILPKAWDKSTAVACSYGYGAAYTPIHIIKGASSILAGDIPLTLIKRSDPVTTSPVVSESIRDEVIELMRNVANMYYPHQRYNPEHTMSDEVIAKTGTAQIFRNGKYQKHVNRMSILLAFPKDSPRYLLFIILEEPVVPAGMAVVANPVVGPTALAIAGRLEEICRAY